MSFMEEEVPASERDEVYQRLQDALIHYDPPDTLGRGNLLHMVFICTAEFFDIF